MSHLEPIGLEAPLEAGFVIAGEWRLTPVGVGISRWVMRRA